MDMGVHPFQAGSGTFRFPVEITDTIARRRPTLVIPRLTLAAIMSALTLGEETLIQSTSALVMRKGSERRVAFGRIRPPRRAIAAAPANSHDAGAALSSRVVLLDEPDGERVTIGSAAVDFHPTDNREDDLAGQ